jgi:hypothetical protein
VARERRYAAVPGMVVDRHRWVYDLLEKQDQLEELFGLRLGDILGCGYFGCVIETDGPWVVKLTVDPTEGPIWSAIEDVVTKTWGETGHYLAAWPRVREIVQLDPGVTMHDGEHALYAIVREAALPAFSHSRSGMSAIQSNHVTLLKMGMTQRMIDSGYDPVIDEWKTPVRNVTPHVMHELVHLDIGRVTRKKMLEIGKQVANMVETLKELYHYSDSGKEAREVYLEWYSDQAEARESAVRHLIDSVTKDEVHMFMDELTDNEFGWPFAELFTTLVDNYIVLADVHAMNIGWRQQKTINGEAQPNCLMVIDPGATPTVQRTIVEKRMIANGRWLG